MERVRRMTGKERAKAKGREKRETGGRVEEDEKRERRGGEREGRKRGRRRGQEEGCRPRFSGFSAWRRARVNAPRIEREGDARAILHGGGTAPG